MVDRRDWAGWLQGPRKSLESQGIDLGYPGQRLGAPETGPGAIARFGGRIVALMIDWISAILLARALRDLIELEFDLDLLTLLVFFLHTWLFITFFGGTFGHRIMKMQIRTLSGKRVSILQSAIRQLLVCLVIPPVIYDRDQRGLHDKATRLILVKI